MPNKPYKISNNRYRFAFSLSETVVSLSLIAVLAVLMLTLNQMTSYKRMVAENKLSQVASSLQGWGRSVTRLNEAGIGALNKMRNQEDITKSIIEYFRYIRSQTSEPDERFNASIEGEWRNFDKITLPNGAVLSVRWLPDEANNFPVNDYILAIITITVPIDKMQGELVEEYMLTLTKLVEIGELCPENTYAKKGKCLPCEGGQISPINSLVCHCPEDKPLWLANICQPYPVCDEFYDENYICTTCKEVYGEERPLWNGVTCISCEEDNDALPIWDSVEEICVNCRYYSNEKTKWDSINQECTCPDDKQYWYNEVCNICSQDTPIYDSGHCCPTDRPYWNTELNDCHTQPVCPADKQYWYNNACHECPQNKPQPLICKSTGAKVCCPDNQQLDDSCSCECSDDRTNVLTCANGERVCCYEKQHLNADCLCVLDEPTERGHCNKNYIPIYTAEELAKIGHDAKYPLHEKYCLMNNVSLSAYSSGKGWEPIGSNKKSYADNAFTGIFDGNGYKISDLYINGTGSMQGLFGFVIARTDTVNILNLGIEGNVTANTSVGLLAGIQSGGIIRDCYASGTVKGTASNVGSHMGGLVGSPRGVKIENCHANVDVSGSYGVGGLIGRADAAGAIGNSIMVSTVSFFTSGNATAAQDQMMKDIYWGGIEQYYYYRDDGKLVTISGNATPVHNTITNCYSTGTVTGTTYSGGLIGVMADNGATISDSYSTSTVKGQTAIGGFAGSSAGSIKRCYSKGSVSYNGSGSGGNQVGGFLGLAGNTNIEECYTSSNVVVSSGSPGGFIGQATGTVSVKNSYCSGAVSTNKQSAGGFIGYLNPVVTSVTINNCYTSSNISVPSSVQNGNTDGLVGNTRNLCTNLSTGSGIKRTTNSYHLYENGCNLAGCCQRIGGTKLTPTEMKTPSTFIDAGWDTTIWELVQGQYPKLKNLGGQ
ncbi:MAG: hypothetical protein K6A44_07460 [bacterium]|nr:hypothetical protein [bacterium]